MKGRPICYRECPGRLKRGTNIGLFSLLSFFFLSLPRRANENKRRMATGVLSGPNVQRSESVFDGADVKHDLFSSSPFRSHAGQSAQVCSRKRMKGFWFAFLALFFVFSLFDRFWSSLCSPVAR